MNIYIYTYLTEFRPVFRGRCVAESISVTSTAYAGAAARTPRAPRTPTGRVVFCINNSCEKGEKRVYAGCVS